MPDKQYGFNEKDVKRIAKAVRANESSDITGDSKGAVYNSNETILAKLTAVNDNSHDTVFAWTQAMMTTDANGVPTFSLASNPLTGAVDKRQAIDNTQLGCAAVGDYVILSRKTAKDVSGNWQIVWCFNGTLKVKQGVVVGDPHDCQSFVTLQPVGTVGEDNQIIAWLHSPHENPCPKKNFDEEAILDYLPTIAGEGVVINPDIGGLQIRIDGEELIATADTFNLINAHGPSGVRDDFTVDKFATEFCDNLTQFDIEWNGIDVTQLTGGTECLGRRILQFDNFDDGTATDGLTLGEGGLPPDGTVFYPVTLNVSCGATDSITAEISAKALGYPPLTIIAIEGDVHCTPVTTLQFDGQAIEEGACLADVSFSIICNPDMSTNTATVSAKAILPTQSITLLSDVTIDSATFDCEAETVSITITKTCQTFTYVSCVAAETATEC